MADGDLGAARVLHGSLAVRDLDAAAGFFRDVFGYAVDFEARGMTDQIARLAGVEGLSCDLAQLTRPGDALVLELVAFRPCPVEAPLRAPPAHLAFAVRDLDAALARATAAGARLLGEVVAFAEGRAAYLEVPGGAAVELEEVA